MATYAIGDLQGCLTPFKQLLDVIAFEPTRDQLWLTGDLVNRGPESLETLRFVRALGSSVITVLGNHDLHLVAVAHGVRAPKRSDTIAAILEAEDCEELCDWLLQRPIAHYDSRLNTLMTHAGVPPNWSLEETLERARELEGVLRGPEREPFLHEMYGNTPEVWSASLTGIERYRVITNAFTRMRFCTPEGRLDMTHKGKADTAPPGLRPWFLHENRLTRGVRVVFGHWAALEGDVDVENVLALDTGCVWGRTLTAHDLETGQRFCVDCSLR
jgi:bis(5'-nucleosyl)-tetraphosphatase (symmetrical)